MKIEYNFNIGLNDDLVKKITDLGITLYMDEIPSLLDWLIPNINGKVFYDVGTHLGLWSVVAAHSGARELHLFEPDGFVVKAKSNIKKINGVKTYANPIALWNRPGCVLSGAYEVEAGQMVDSIDNYVDSHVLCPQPDFIKIDVEGAEIEVLNGARQTIEREKPMLMIESHDNITLDWDRKQEILDLVGSWNVYDKVEMKERLPTYHIFFKN
jgi:FkbM family methyltransferase